MPTSDSASQSLPHAPKTKPLLPADRRRFLALCTAAGLGQTLLPGALLAMAQAPQPPAPAPAAGGGGGGRGGRGGGSTGPKITPEMLAGAAAVAGVTLTPEQTQMMLNGVANARDSAVQLRAIKMENAIAPADIFDPVPAGMVLDTVKKPAKFGKAPDVSALAAKVKMQGGALSEDICFATLRELAELVRTKKVSSVALTQMYIGRLKRLDPQLHCVITITEERAMKQAHAADAEIAAGKYRGPLHGIPWGAKDLLAVKGYPTTWGAGGFQKQEFDYDAEVVKRLDVAGAVLIAKLTMGALAQGDMWFGGRTRNPWNTAQGSSGSSAGPASATSAGCVGFSIGTETQGSISSPSTRCGVSGLRPSFGLVPRTGAMALSWSMDKIGPICRSVEDCAIVLSVIAGQDGQDRSIQPAAYNWDADFDWKKLRVGYIASAFQAPAPRATPTEATAGAATPNGAAVNPAVPAAAAAARAQSNAADMKFNTAALDVLRGMGVQLKAVELPNIQYGLMGQILDVEAAAAFQDLTLSGRDALLTEQGGSTWPNTFRTARFYSAVDYVQAMRMRTVACELMGELFRDVDVIVCPSSGTQGAATNLTGIPAVIVPNGIREGEAPKPDPSAPSAGNAGGGPGTPVSITFLGAMYSDARLAAFAKAYQEKTGFHKLHPKIG